MEKVIIFILIFLSVSLEIDGQEVKQLLFDGSIKIEGNFLRGKLSFFARTKNEKLNGLSIIVGISLFKINDFISQKDLENKKINNFSVKEGSHIIMRITPSFFTKDGGIIELKIFLEDKFQEERILIKKINDTFVALRIFPQEKTERIKHINFLLKGSIFKLSQLQLKKYTVNLQ